MDDALLVLLLTAAACAPLGVFLILRRLSMMADAISHTVLLGIVLAFFLTHDLGSPWLLFGAALMGVITVSLVELLGKTNLVKYDDAIGVIFPLLFALAVILISKYAGNAHLDTDMVLMGEVIYAGLNTVEIGGAEIAASALKMGGLILVIAAFITVFYKELKVSTFDGEYARLIGVPTGIFFYAFMSLTSLTTVAAFDAVGAILVISFFIAPGATALLFTKHLSHTILLALLVGIVNSVVGYVIAVHTNASIAGLCAVINMLVYAVALLTSPKGMITTYVRRLQSVRQMQRDLFLLHIGRHTAERMKSAENHTDRIGDHLKWDETKVQRVSRELIERRLLTREGSYYLLTDAGSAAYTALCRRYYI
ncbi:metal ABC transporter permease [Selenomonas sp. TAMA-11512]|uniref:metal ABC transporter permease n=1 Tax=Selenomonas sp. TAMA-11512 TaxID=3095337 RepID=UPI0030925E6A|nr:metal ABC transporter permease [Selenomonas sp. TAMA-11512]